MATTLSQDPLVGFQVPGTPAPPVDVLATRHPAQPSTFSVSLTNNGLDLLIIVGSKLLPLGSFQSLTYNIYFLPINAANQIIMSSYALAYAAWTTSTLILTQAAPPFGGVIQILDTALVNTDGWYFATASSSNGLSSFPTFPRRAPAFAGGVNLFIPPNVSAVSVAKASASLYGVTVSNITCKFTVPTNTNGVTGVVVTNPGSGYSTPPTISFSGGLQPGGVGASAQALIGTGGAVSSVIIASGGSGYISAPAVTFSGSATGYATVGPVTAFDGVQMYLTNYRGGGQVEGPYIDASTIRPGQQALGTFPLIPDAGHTTTFTFVSVSRAGIRSTSGAPTASLIV